MLSRKYKKESGTEIPFAKPKDPAAATRHLYCCNCPPLVDGADWTTHDLVIFCREHARAEVQDFFSVAGKPWAVVTFTDAAAAGAAMLELQQRPLNGRKVHVQYAVPARTPQPAVAAIPCTSESKDVEVPGLVLESDFVSPDEEVEILAHLDSLQWEAQMSRRVVHFGFTFDYVSRRCTTPARSLEPCLQRLAARAEQRGLLSRLPDQCTVNEYLPGQGIRSHIDTHSAFEDGLMSVSLGAQVVMDFKGTGAAKAVVLPPRSALVLHGAARYAWQHGIATRKSDLVDGQVVPRARRVSLTFRAVRHTTEPCSCAFPLHCDSQFAPIPPSRKDWEAAEGTGEGTCRGERVQGAGPIPPPSHECGAEQESPEIERTHVHQVYDAIAAHFSATRYKPWPRVAEFLQSLPPGSLVADVGCGNGKYMRDARHFIVGSDRSRPLAEIAASRAAFPGAVCVGDATYVACRTGVFDAALSIAVLHHLSTRQRRVKALRELARLVRVGGSILVYAWSQEQGAESRFSFSAPDELVPWTAMQLPPRNGAGGHALGQEGDGREVAGEQQEGQAAQGEAVLRYCHLYQRGELTQLCADVAGVKVEEEFWDCSNCCVLLRRVSSF